jgi:hypothetical protein
MRLSTILFSLAALFVAVGASPGYSVDKRGELVPRVVSCFPLVSPFFAHRLNVM